MNIAGGVGVCRPDLLHGERLPSHNIRIKISLFTQPGILTDHMIYIAGEVRFQYTIQWNSLVMIEKQ